MAGHCRHCPEYAAAGRRLFDRDMPPGLREEATALLASAKEAAPADLLAALVLRLGLECLGLRLTVLEEVLTPTAIHTIPGRTTPIFPGLANVNGELLPCLSLRHLLGIQTTARETTPADRPRFLVVRRQADRFVLPADEVLGVVRFRLANLRRAPETVAAAPRNCAAGVFDWNDRTVALLDDAKLFLLLDGSLRA
jgi:chemotaxis-related protein WspD